MFYPCRPAPRRTVAWPSRLRRAALPQPLLVPRRRVGARRPGRAGGRARAGRAGRHGPPGPLRRGPVLDGGRGGRAAPGDRGRDRARRCGGRRTRAGSWCRPRRAAGDPAGRPPVVAEPPRRGVEGRPARPRARARAGCPAIGGGEGGPPRDRRGAARAAPPAARPGRDGLAEPVPDGVPGEPRGDEGGAAVHPGAAGRARARG